MRSYLRFTPWGSVPAVCLVETYTFAAPDTHRQLTPKQTASASFLSIFAFCLSSSITFQSRRLPCWSSLRDSRHSELEWIGSEWCWPLVTHLLMSGNHTDCRLEEPERPSRLCFQSLVVFSGQQSGWFDSIHDWSKERKKKPGIISAVAIYNQSGNYPFFHGLNVLIVSILVIYWGFSRTMKPRRPAPQPQMIYS